VINGNACFAYFNKIRGIPAFRLLKTPSKSPAKSMRLAGQGYRLIACFGGRVRF
jgi:hypothetical protein